MEKTEVAGVHVNLLVEAHDAAGNLAFQHEVHNLVLDAGFNALCKAIGTGTAAQITHFALGTGTNAVAPGDTQLQTEILRDVVTQRTQPTAKHLILKYYLNSLIGNGNTITEAALIAGTICFARATFPGEQKTVNLAWTFTWDITFQNI